MFHLFEQARRHYFRIRKITGLAPTGIDIERELTRFLIETRKQMEALPFVYRRLFRIEPLLDDRFFSGRNDELIEFEQCFRNWQAGQFAITALVGEKGSGRTTLINFAEQRFLKNQSIIRSVNAA